MKKLLGLAAIGALAFAPPALATNGMRMIGFGSVQNSMGGVGVGATLDASSVATNPAGLADLGQRLDVSFSWFKPTVDYDARQMAGAPAGAFVMADGRTLDSSRGGSPLPAIAYVRPISEGLSAGLGVFGAAGMGVDYGANLYGGKTFTDYLQARLTPGVAYRVNEYVAIGATANLMLAQMAFDVAAGAGQAKHDTATSFGVGATLAVKVTPVKMLTIGAAWETQSAFQDFSFDVPARQNPFAAPGTMFAAGTDELAFDQPQVLTVGFALQPLEALLVAADVEWINWSATMGEGEPKYTSDWQATGAQPFDMRWDDQVVYKLGVQVTPARGLDLRVGWNYGKMPLDETRAFENLAFPAVVEHHLTAGGSYAVSEKLGASLGVMYAPKVTLSGANGAPPPPMGGTGQGIAAYETSMSQWEVDVGLTYRF